MGLDGDALRSAQSHGRAAGRAVVERVERSRHDASSQDDVAVALGADAPFAPRRLRLRVARGLLRAEAPRGGPEGRAHLVTSDAMKTP
jgi:hypothetical protein